jgi:hypothetical protein
MNDGRRVAHTVPTGAVITLDSSVLDSDELIDVTWDGKKVLMFAQDLRSRAKRVAEA